MEKVRIDKWLWSVRIFKSRTMATDACKSSQVRIDDTAVKPSFLIVPGTIVDVKKDGFNLKYRVESLIEKRVGAPIAQTCYTNLTPPEELNKFSEWYLKEAGSEMRQKGTGRPTKRERRDIDKVKDK